MISKKARSLVRNSRFGPIIKRFLRPFLPGWVDEGRKIVQGSQLEGMLKRVEANSLSLAYALNAGAGQGLYSHLLTHIESVQRITEVDVSYGEHLRCLTDARQHLVAASLTAIPLADETINLILCSEVLEHITDDEAALDELRRVLAPGGWMLITVPTPPAVYDPAHVREGYYPADLSRMLKERGLEIVELRFCMYSIFKFFLKIYRNGRVPRCVVWSLSILDRAFPLGSPMDLMVLAHLKL
jgi:SAM-dependent methyltransferase